MLLEGDIAVRLSHVGVVVLIGRQQVKHIPQNVDQEVLDLGKMKQSITQTMRKFVPGNFFFLFLAGIVNAIGVTIFIAPVQLYDSGISGTSILLSQVTPEYFSLSFFLMILNVPLLLYGLKRQGAVFSVYAIFAVCVYALAAWVITDILSVDVSIASPLAGTDLFLCALFGGLISGIGSGMAIRFGGAMDGIEVIAVVFARRMGISVGTFVLIYNVLLYIICGIVIGSWILPLYSIVTYWAGSKTVDFIVDGLDSAKSAMIITTKPQEVGKAISEEFGTGITVIDARGYYSNEAKTLLYVVVNQFQIVKIKNLVKSIDPNAYITITLVADLLHGSKNSGTEEQDPDTRARILGEPEQNAKTQAEEKQEDGEVST